MNVGRILTMRKNTGKQHKKKEKYKTHNVELNKISGIQANANAKSEAKRRIRRRGENTQNNRSLHSEVYAKNAIYIKRRIILNR